MEDQVRWASGLNLLAGLWLIFSPLWIHYAVGGNAWQQVVLGIVISLLAIGRLSVPRVSWPSWVNFLAGIYLIVAPWFVTSATTAVRWNQVILGIIVAGLALWSTSGSMALDASDRTTATGQPAGGFYERLEQRRNRRR